MQESEYLKVLQRKYLMVKVWDILARTIEYLLIAVTLKFGISLLLALLLNKVRVGLFFP